MNMRRKTSWRCLGGVSVRSAATSAAAPAANVSCHPLRITLSPSTSLGSAQVHVSWPTLAGLGSHVPRQVSMSRSQVSGQHAHPPISPTAEHARGTERECQLRPETRYLPEATRDLRLARDLSRGYHVICLSRIFSIVELWMLRSNDNAIFDLNLLLKAHQK